MLILFNLLVNSYYAGIKKHELRYMFWPEVNGQHYSYNIILYVITLTIFDIIADKHSSFPQKQDFNNCQARDIVFNNRFFICWR